MPQKHNLKIAITFTEKNTSILQAWYGSGLLQNLKFYYDLFELMGHEVYFLLNKSYLISHQKRVYKTMENEQILKEKTPFDIVIEAGSTVPLKNKERIKSDCGAHIIGLRCGNQLFMLTEDLLVSKNLVPGQIVTGQDQMWILPHHAKQKSFVETLHSCPTIQVPYIWESDFITKRFVGENLPKKVDIKVMEPNISVLKNAVVPFVVVEYLYRNHPDSFDKVTFFNTESIANDEAFLINFVQHLGVLQGRENRSYFGSREFFDRVFTRPDILLGNQHENELNYLYNEALHMGVPLVHNSPSYADVGYYYPDFQVDAAAEQILNAIAHYNNEEYIKRNESFLYDFSIHNPRIQKAYQLLLDQALDTTIS